MTPPCNGCDCCLPLDADDLRTRRAGSLVHVWAYVDHAEPLHVTEGEERDLTEKLDRALVVIEALRPKVAKLEQRATEAEALAARWKQSAQAGWAKVDALHALITGGAR